MTAPEATPLSFSVLSDRSTWIIGETRQLWLDGDGVVTTFEMVDDRTEPVEKFAAPEGVTFAELLGYIGAE